jgi:hypothetical protein
MLATDVAAIMVECKMCHKKVKGHADRNAHKHRFGCPNPEPEPDEAVAAGAVLLLSLTSTSSPFSSSSSSLDELLTSTMAVVRRDGCASLAALWSDMKVMLPEASSCYDRMLRRLKLTCEGKQMIPRANGGRWAAIFDPDVAFDTAVPHRRRHPFARLLIQLFAPSLISAIATYLACLPELITMDGVQAVLYHGQAVDQPVHIDHSLGANVSVLLIFSLTSSPITTRFAIGTHTCPFDMTLPPGFASTCVQLPATPFIIADPAIFHYGVGGGADPKQLYGADRVFITLSRPLNDKQRHLHSADTGCLLHRPTLRSLLA